MQSGLGRRMAKGVLGRMPTSARESAKRIRLDLLGLGQLKANQAMLALRLGELEHQLGQLPPDPAPVTDDRFPPLVRSKLCTQNQLYEPWYTGWLEAMGETPLAHRKHWEFAYVAEVLDQLGMLQPGKRAVGFGVGREPLVSLFASRGVEVLATDLDASAKEAEGWVRSAQHAQGVTEALLRPDVVDQGTFEKLVSWRPADMRAVPTDLRGFDFTWSVCALEHLGSLEAGWSFVEQSVATLAPGGIAVHTTEFNVSSNDETLETGPAVVYRERDCLELKERLEAAGHQVATFDFSRGEGVLDRYIDVPPYSDEPVLRFWMASHALTSVAIVVRAAG